MDRNTLSRAERLRSLKAIRRLFSEGKSGFVYPLRYNFLVATEEIPACETASDASAADCEAVSNEIASEGSVSESARRVSIMFSVPKRFHKRANRRNLLKRRMREAYRLNRSGLVEQLSQQGLKVDIALVYSTKESHSYKTVEYALQRILEQISKRL